MLKKKGKKMTYVLYRAINVPVLVIPQQNNRFPMSVFTIIVDSKASAELRAIIWVTAQMSQSHSKVTFDPSLIVGSSDSQLTATSRSTKQSDIQIDKGSGTSSRHSVVDGEQKFSCHMFWL